MSASAIVRVALALLGLGAFGLTVLRYGPPRREPARLAQMPAAPGRPDPTPEQERNAPAPPRPATGDGMVRPEGSGASSAALTAGDQAPAAPRIEATEPESGRQVAAPARQSLPAARNQATEPESSRQVAAPARQSLPAARNQATEPESSRQVAAPARQSLPAARNQATEPESSGLAPVPARESVPTPAQRTVGTGPEAGRTADGQAAVRPNIPRTESQPGRRAAAPSRESSPAASQGSVGTRPDAARNTDVKASPGPPSFDVVRVDPSGESVIAGRAAPGATVELLRDGAAHDRVVADQSGQFAMTPPPLASGDHELMLRLTTADGRQSLSKEVVTIAIAPGRREKPMVALTAPDRPTRVLSTPEAAGAGIAATAPDGAAAAASPTAAPPRPSGERLAAAPPGPAAPAPSSAAAPPAREPSGDERARTARLSDAAPGAAGQPPARAGPKATAPKTVARDPVRVEVVETERGGKLYVSGRAVPGATVRLYLNDSYLASATAAAGEGRLAFDVAGGVGPGDYRVRLDEVDSASGRVKSRAEVPFKVPPTMTAAAPTNPPVAPPNAPARPSPAAGSAAAAPNAPAGPSPALDSSAELSAAPRKSPARSSPTLGPSAERSAASPAAPTEPLSPNHPNSAASEPLAPNTPRSAAAPTPAAAARIAEPSIGTRGPAVSTRAGGPSPADPSAAPSGARPAAAAALAPATGLPSSQPSPPAVASPSPSPASEPARTTAPTERPAAGSSSAARATREAALEAGAGAPRSDSTVGQAGIGSPSAGGEQQTPASVARADAAPLSIVLVPEVKTTIVSRGDSLWRISRWAYGRGVRYTVIFAANHSQIRNPRLIYPGQVFVLPGEQP